MNELIVHSVLDHYLIHGIYSIDTTQLVKDVLSLTNTPNEKSVFTEDIETVEQIDDLLVNTESDNSSVGRILLLAHYGPLKLQYHVDHVKNITSSTITINHYLTLVISKLTPLVKTKPTPDVALEFVKSFIII